MKKLFLSLFFISLVLIVWLVPDDWGHYPISLDNLVGQVFRETVTPESLRETYRQNSFTILLVPGHDHEYSGAEYRSLKESEMNLAVARYLKADLEALGHWRVLTTRDLISGDYEKSFAEYFEQERSGIDSFRTQLRDKFASLVRGGEITVSKLVEHNFAPGEVGNRLYGINRWANDHDVDLTLHLHFNSQPNLLREPGRYSGFAIYVPERQLPNARASLALAQAIQATLATFTSVSNLAGEAGSPVEDQELIAVGANGSRTTASLLIEYGYIDESQFHYQSTRELAFRELSWQTARGLADYFQDIKTLPTTKLVTSSWNQPLSLGLKGSKEVMFLQAAFYRAGFYPPSGRSLQSCPINGNFGSCVQAAVTSFQEKNGIVPSDGIVAGETLSRINALYSQ